MTEPAREVFCTECGKPMELMMTEEYTTDSLTKVREEIYHCRNCHRDEVVEEVWQLMEVRQQRFFHG